MNREIKFRAWHPGITGKACFPPAMLYDNIPGDCLRWQAEGQALELMQLTGLKDKNGIEIYEGDIVRADDDSATGEMVFREGLFIVSHPHIPRIPYTVNLSADEWLRWEVIGNIYEHPHLLQS